MHAIVTGIYLYFLGEVKRRLDQFTRQLNDTREEGSVDERDLTEFTKKLKKIQTDLNSISSSFVIRDDSNTVLVAKLAIVNGSKPIESMFYIRYSTTFNSFFPDKKKTERNKIIFFLFLFLKEESKVLWTNKR